MNDIRNLLRIARRRLETSTFLRCAHKVALVLGGLILMLMVIDKAPAQEFLPWAWIIPIASVLLLLVALALWSRRIRTELQVAMAVDERLDLREKLSTALHCQGRDDVFAQAAIEDAVKTAQDARSRELVGRKFKVTAPRGWWLSPMLLLLALALSYLPPFDLFHGEDELEQANLQQARLDAEQSIDDLVKIIKEKPQLSQELSDLIGELTLEGIDPDAMRSEKDIKRNALKKVTDLNKKLDELINGEKSKTSQSIDKTLSQLKTPKDGPAKDLADAVAKGDFQAALKALDELQAKLKDGDLTEEQKKELEKQLNDLAEQLKQLSEKKEQLEAALKKAGLDPQLAQNPQALQQAIQNNPNLNEQQKKQLMQMAQAQQAANEMCQGMGQAMQQMGQGIMNGQFGQGANQLGQQLSQMEAMRMLLQEARAAQNACMGQGLSLGQGLAMMSGGAFGNRGQGRGGKAPIAPTPTGYKQIKANIKTTEGDIIARMLFDGPQVVGESKAKFKQVAAEATEGFDEALAEDQLPRRYHDTQKHYFGELKKLTEASETEDEESSSSEEEKSSQTETDD